MEEQEKNKILFALLLVSIPFLIIAYCFMLFKLFVSLSIISLTLITLRLAKREKDFFKNKEKLKIIGFFILFIFLCAFLYSFNWNFLSNENAEGESFVIKDGIGFLIGGLWLSCIFTLIAERIIEIKQEQEKQLEQQTKQDNL